MKVISISTNKKDEVMDITDIIESLVRAKHFQDGICSISVLHTTCGVTTADLDPGTDQDFLDALRKLLPSIKYRHPHDPSHTPDHILSSLIGSSISVPVANGQLVLGMWQRIVLVELDGPRERQISISFLSEYIS
ncbi:MAG: secondary thiamine-phosphate synthase enzyme YjbQ [Patescibacteria group bacterium]|nr:secondary thiamine-phosphate synthase enzyme YjbQ [Patescibacteria group bacterium]